MLNEERLIGSCLEALLGLEYPRDRYEIVVVDNGSTDGSRDAVGHFPGVRLLVEREAGDYAARNRGVLESHGRFCAFTDADTAPDADWLQRAWEVFSDTEVEVIVGCLRLAEDGRGLLGLIEAYERARGDFVFDGEDPALYYGFTANQIVRRTTFDRLGLFPSVYRNSDTVFVQRVLSQRGLSAVVFREDVRASRLEVETFRNYLEKQHTYGRDFGRYAAEVDVRPLSLSERLDVFRRVVRNEAMPSYKTGLLGFALLSGAVAYESGRLRGPPSR